MSIQVCEVDEGHSFIWKGDSYVVIRHEDDNVIVHRTVSATGHVIPDDKRFEENFNPYAYVDKVLG